MKEPPEWEQLRENGHEIDDKMRELWEEIVTSESEIEKAFAPLSPELKHALKALVNYVERNQDYQFYLQQRTAMNTITAAIE